MRARSGTTPQPVHTCPAARFAAFVVMLAACAAPAGAQDPSAPATEPAPAPTTDANAQQAGVREPDARAATGGSPSRAATAGPAPPRARAAHPTFFQHGQFGAGYRFAVGGSGDLRVRVRVRHGMPRHRNRLVHTWDLGWAAAGSGQEVNWHGALPTGWAPQGPYTLEVRATDRRGRGLSRADVEASRARVRFYRHRFPVRGRRDMGSSAARFGAGRGDHSHQGHDVFAAAGTPVVAARRGRVAWRQYQAGGAGHYLVIHGDDGFDYVYMHLREPSSVAPGDVVRDGPDDRPRGLHRALLGGPPAFRDVDASHWYDGGAPFDPLGHLRRWARWS